MSSSAMRAARGGIRVGLLVWLATGCVTTISQDRSTAADETRDCLIPLPANVTALSAPVSLEYPDASLLVWEWLPGTDGSPIANAWARAGSGTALCASGPTLATDASGAVQSLLALRPTEADENARRNDGRRLALSPRGGFVYAGTGYLYYEHTLLGPGAFDAESLGTGLCVVSSTDEPCTRLEVSGDTKLWPPSAWPKNQGGLIADGRAYVLGCRHIASFDDPCVISSVPVAQIEDPSAYRYYNAFDGWVEPPEGASVVFNLAGASTLTPVGDQYAATHLDVFAPTFSVQLAPTPTGDFGHPIRLFDGVAPSGPFTQGGREHHALRQGDRGLAFSYFVDRPGADYGLHLLNLELHRGLQ